MRRASAAELAEVFVSKANRECLQKALSRGNTLMVTAVEVDYAFPPGTTLIRHCHAILSAAALWRSLSRCCSLVLRNSLFRHSLLACLWRSLTHKDVSGTPSTGVALALLACLLKQHPLPVVLEICLPFTMMTRPCP